MNALRSSITATALAVVALTSAPVPAGTIWDGGGVNDNWTTGANWNAINSRQVAPPNNGTANIHLAGATRRTPMLNVPYSINSLTFDKGSAAFVNLGAQELTIGAGGVKNYDADIQTVIGPIRLAANQTWTAAAGRLQMDEVNLNGFGLTFGGAFPTDMIGVIQGAGNLVLPDAYASTVTMLGPNTYSGATTVAGGTLVLKKTTSGGVAIPGRLTIGGGSAIPLATVRLEANEQISHAPGNEVTILVGGLLDVNTRTETLAKLLVTGGGDATVGTGGKLTASAAVVTGVGSTWTNPNGYGSNFYVGEVGASTLDIMAGGKVTSGLAYLGYGSEVTVNGDASTWDVSGLSIGSGALNITDGGIVNTAGAATIGANAGSTGVVNVDGADSAWKMPYNGSLFLGYQGTGNLNVTNGGFVYGGQTIIGGSAVGNVRIDGPGSNWYSNHDIQVSKGELAVTNQGRVTSALPLLVNSLGTLSGNSVVESNFVYNGGRVEPGPSTDALTIGGYYIQQPTGVLEIELGGSNDFDQLLVPGNIASLDGTLEVKLTGGFTPLIGQSFTILTSHDVDGEFANLLLPSLPGRRFDVIYNPQSVVLEVNFAFGAGAVPEPASLALLTVAMAGACWRRVRAAGSSPSIDP